MALNQNIKLVPKWEYKACWAHEHKIWWKENWYAGYEVYQLKFIFKGTKKPEVEIFVSELQKLFKDCFTYTYEGYTVVFDIDFKKFSTLANMFGMMGLFRYIEEFPTQVESFCFFHKRYGSKLNALQKVYLSVFFSESAYYGGHDYLNLGMLKRGDYSLDYFKDADAHVARFLGNPIEKEYDYNWSGVPMTKSIWPTMVNMKGPPFIDTKKLSQFNNLLEFKKKVIV